MKNKIVVYTAIFGQRDVLLEPECIPPGVDFVCFTDQSFRSKTWEVRVVEPPIADDLSRSNRYYKMHPHVVLGDYDISVYIDGNVVITGDITELIDAHLQDANLAGFDHALYHRIPLTTLKAQTERLQFPGQDVRNNETFANIQNQYDAYIAAGYPDDQGLMWCMTLLRRHNEADVIVTMEAWWNELLQRSKRDQMSFNYVAWKQALRFNYIPLDGAANQYIRRDGHYRSRGRKIWDYLKVANRKLHARVRLRS